MANTMGSPIEPIVPRGMDILEIIDRLKEVQKEDIEGIYISAELTFAECPRRGNYGGVELLKHIRLTSELRQIRLLPIILAIWRKLEEYLRQRAENIVLCSPGVITIRLPLDGNKLSTRLQEISRFRSFQSMYDAVRDYFPITNQDRAASVHDYRNRVGAAKFAKELFGADTDNETIVNDFENFRKATLWSKKMEFHQEAVGEAIIQPMPSEALRKVREECKGARILLVDDEHRRGWSYALCKALVEEIPAEAFESGDHHIRVARGRFQCIDTFAVALEYFREQRAKLEDALLKWSKAQNRLLHYQEEERQVGLELPARLKLVEEQKDAKQKAVDIIKQKVEEAEKEVQNAENHLQQKEASFLFTYQDVIKLIKSPSAVTDLSELLKAQDNLNRLMTEWNTASDSLESIRRELQNLENALSKLRGNQKLLAENLEKAESDHNKSLEDLIACFEHDLVFLDLRLRPFEDTNRNISETSGIKLLQEIKSYDPSIPVVVLTASQKALSLLETLAYGVEGYWIKDTSRTFELVATVTKLMNNIGFRRRVWRKIQQVESKSAFRRYRVQRDAILEDQLVKEAEELQRVKTILRECFAFMIGKESGVAQSITGLEPYEEIALRLGQIQEFRLYFPDDIKREEKGIWPTLRKKNYVSEEDDKIREYRNNAAHFYSKRFSNLSKVGSPVSPEQVLESLEYTLDSLLTTKKQIAS